MIGFEWGAPKSFYQGRPPPYEVLPVFSSFVANFAKQVQVQPSLTKDSFVFEVWNEVDGPAYWWHAPWRPGSDAFLENFTVTYCAAERAIHGILPAFDVAGPTLSYYNKSLITTFLDLALQKQPCEVNVLTWHEIYLNPLKSTLDIETHLREIRQLIQNPKYAPLKIREIHINEIGEAPEQYWPGEDIFYLSALELGGADKASRACWGELTGPSGIWGSEHCAKGSLDGLAIPWTSENPPPSGWSATPRAGWWVYKAYAAGVPTRVSSVSSHPGIAALSSRDGLETGSVQVLVGHGRMPIPPPPGEWSRLQIIPETQPGIPVVIELRDLTALPQLAGASRVRAKVQRIPSSGEAALPQPVDAGEFEAAISGGVVSIPVGTLEYQEAFIIAISKAG